MHIRQRPRGAKEVMVTRSGGVKRNAGNRTLLNFNFVKKKKIMEETEDLYKVTSKVSVDKKLFLYTFRIVYEIERLTTHSIP